MIASRTPPEDISSGNAVPSQFFEAQSFVVIADFFKKMNHCALSADTFKT